MYPAYNWSNGMSGNPVTTYVGGLYMATFTLNGVAAKTVKLSIQQ